MDDLHKLAKALLEYETLSGEEVTLLLSGGELDRREKATPTAKRDSGRDTPRRASVPIVGGSTTTTA